ncbi:MAG: serine/threonine-protein kinase [Candidatus Ornithospirochaeta sp.]|nr:serine/threonine-protein kinase [Candidatus Ornithospirochaeta sp.]
MEELEGYSYPFSNIGKGICISRRISDGRIVAIKHAPLSSEAVYRHLAEHEYMGIPRIFEIRKGSCLTIVEEYIEGRNLRAIMEEGHRFKEEEAVGIIVSILTILRPLHSMHPSIIHRDIKPENIILDKDGKAWLIDWGAAKQERENKQRDTVLMGTDGYAAPEQYGFSQSDPSTDIYAIGVLLNELLTGKLPKEAECKGYLRRIVEKCTELDKADRYSCVDELLDELQSRRHRRWLLPGFRGQGIALKAVSGLLYLLLAYSALNMEVTDSAGTADTVLNRVFAFILFFSLVLFFGNWAGIWQSMPLMKSSRTWKKAMGLLLWPILIASAVMTMFYLLRMLIVG